MQKYFEWNTLAIKLKELKAKEAEIRRELCEKLFNGRVGGFKVKDHFTSDDGIDWEAVATSKVKVTVDRELLNSIWNDLTEEEQAIFRWKPEVNKTDYIKMKKADPKMKSIVWDVFKEGVAMPTLELKEVE